MTEGKLNIFASQNQDRQLQLNRQNVEVKTCVLQLLFPFCTNFTKHFLFRCAAYATLNRNYFKLDFHSTSGVLCMQSLIEILIHSAGMYTLAMALVGYAQVHS